MKLNKDFKYRAFFVLIYVTGSVAFTTGMIISLIFKLM